MRKRLEMATWHLIFVTKLSSVLGVVTGAKDVAVSIGSNRFSKIICKN